MAQKRIYVPRDWERLANLQAGMFIAVDDAMEDVREVASVTVVRGKWIVTFVGGTVKRFGPFGEVMTFFPID